MKVFIGSLVTLAVTLTLVVFAAVYTSAYARDLLSLADTLPTERGFDFDNAVNTVKEMEAYSAEKGRILLLFVNHNEAESLNAKISELRTRLETDSFEDYYSKLSELKYELSEFRISEGFSLKSIL